LDFKNGCNYNFNKIKGKSEKLRNYCKYILAAPLFGKWEKLLIGL
jgi:hypothetical protein